MELALALSLALIFALSLLILRFGRNLAYLSSQLDETRREVRSLSLDLKKERARTSTLLSQVDEGLLIVDEHRRVTWANPAAARLLGGTPLFGRFSIEVLPHLEAQGAIAAALKGEEKSLDKPLSIGQRLVHLQAVPLDNEGALLRLQDISEVERLAQARRDLVGNLSHELRTPLTSLRLLVDTLQGEDLSDAARTQGHLAKIEATLGILERLAQGLLELAQIEAGQSTLRMIPHGLAMVVASTWATLSPQAERKGLRLSASIPSDITVLADEEKLRTIISNLLHNAIKFSPQGAKIRIEGEMQGKWVEVRVSDQGPGIPAAYLPRIFERFFKSDPARTGEAGFGLGLAIAKHLVEAHGGRIWAESREGKGSTFHFTLPKNE